MAFGGPRSSCIRPGTHSTQHQDSHNDWTPCRMAEPFVSAGAHAPHSARRLRSLAFLGSSVGERATKTGHDQSQTVLATLNLMALRSSVGANPIVISFNGFEPLPPIHKRLKQNLKLE